MRAAPPDLVRRGGARLAYRLPERGQPLGCARERPREGVRRPSGDRRGTLDDRPPAPGRERPSRTWGGRGGTCASRHLASPACRAAAARLRGWHRRNSPGLHEPARAHDTTGLWRRSRPSRAGATLIQKRTFFNDVIERLRMQPSVSAATIADGLPLAEVVTVGMNPQRFRSDDPDSTNPPRSRN